MVSGNQRGTRISLTHGLTLNLSKCHQETIQELLHEAYPPIPKNAIQRDMLKISLWARVRPERFQLMVDLLGPCEYFELVRNLAQLPRHLVRHIIQWSCYRTQF